MSNQVLGTLSELARTVIFQISQWSHRVLVGMEIEGNYWIILDILVVTFIIYWFLSKILESKAVRVLYGIIIVIVLLFLGHFLNLLTMNWLLKYLGLMLVVAVPIIFQPEIRSALDKLGSFGSSKRTSFSKKSLEEILIAISFLAKKRIGAAIAIERRIPLKEYTKSGHDLHADVTKELIVSIFSLTSPLHDGAMIISADKIIAAGCMLPVPEEKDTLGARHRAAKDLSKHTDTIVLVISEERGTISVAFDGDLEMDLKLKEIKNILEKVFNLN